MITTDHATSLDNVENILIYNYFNNRSVCYIRVYYKKLTRLYCLKICLKMFFESVQ